MKSLVLNPQSFHHNFRFLWLMTLNRDESTFNPVANDLDLPLLPCSESAQIGRWITYAVCSHRRLIHRTWSDSSPTPLNNREPKWEALNEPKKQRFFSLSNTVIAPPFSGGGGGRGDYEEAPSCMSGSTAKGGVERVRGCGGRGSAPVTMSVSF